MADISNAIFQMAILLIVTLVGYLAARLGYLDMYVKDKVTALLLNITLPCMILASAGNLDAQALGSQVPLSLLLGVLSFFLWIVVAFLFNAFFRVPRNQRPLYYFMSVCTNTSFVGIPVADALYGESAALLCSIYIMATSTLMYSIGIALLVAGKNEPSQSASDSLDTVNESASNHCHSSSEKAKRIIRAVISPLTIAALLAIGLVFSGIKLPSILQDSADLIGSLTPPLAMMLVGVIVANERFSNVVREWRLYPYIFIRQLFASALAYLVLKQFLTDPILLGIFAVMFAMPVGSMASMFCASYGRDAVLPAKGTILSTVASFAIVPLLVAFIAFV